MKISRTKNANFFLIYKYFIEINKKNTSIFIKQCVKDKDWQLSCKHQKKFFLNRRKFNLTEHYRMQISQEEIMFRTLV